MLVVVVVLLFVASVILKRWEVGGGMHVYPDAVRMLSAKSCWSIAVK